MVLLTPGPCMTSETVRQAAAMPDMNHRDPEFMEMLRETKDLLLGVYPQIQNGEFGWPDRKPDSPLRTGNPWRPYLIGGSGTAAVEAMITSCIRAGPVLLIDSGYYSGRMSAKLEAHGIPYDVLAADSAKEGIDSEELEVLLDGNRFNHNYEAVVTTHHETSTGRLHDLSHLAGLCNDNNIKLLVDAMSSFGADDLDFTYVDAVASSANKCLHGLPGLSFVLVRDWLADEMRDYKPQTVYLSLPFYEGDSPPLTPPVPILAALRQALRELGPGGAPSRRVHYLRKRAIIRDALSARGFRFLIGASESSCSLTTASIPEGWTSDEWFGANLDAGFMIYQTKGILKERWFQVANMGEITEDHLHLWLAAVDDILKSR